MHNRILATTPSPIVGIYALTPDLADTDDLCARVGAALAGGVRLVQYRNKTVVEAGQRLRQATLLRRLCTDNDAILIVNDDVALAASVHADGVHLGRDDAALPYARATLGPHSIIGASCYDSMHRAEVAVAAGADYIAFGSFYPSSVKPNAVRAAPSLLRAAKARWDVPVVAIGGITHDNAAPLLAAGADALAVVTALFGARDIAAAAYRLITLFNADAARVPSSSAGEAGKLRGE